MPVKRADISGKCIWGANLAALTTWPLNLRCVVCLLGTPQPSEQLAATKEMGTCPKRRRTKWRNNHYQQGRLPSLQSFVYKRLTTIPTSTVAAPLRLTRRKKNTHQRLNYQHESRTNAVVPTNKQHGELSTNTIHAHKELQYF